MKIIFVLLIFFNLFGCSSELETNNTLIRGTVKFIEFEGGFFGIITDDGAKYDPINLPNEFKVNGLRIEFNFNERKGGMSFHQWGTIIEITEIKEIKNYDYEISVGETFKIELASNATTGYSWKWVNKEIKSIVDSVEHKYIGSSSNAMGAGGKEIWTFKGIAKGEATIILEYCRSWEKNSTVQEAKYLVKVEK